MRCVIIALTCTATTTCAAPKTGDVGVEAGFVASANGSAFLYTTDGRLAPTTPIQLQYPATRDAVACCLRLLGSALDPPSVSAEPVSDALFGNPVFRYRLKQLPPPLQGDPFVGAAAIGARPVSTNTASGRTIMRVEAASPTRVAIVETCLGSEGSNLFLIADGKLKTQIYYSFGYAVKATCDPKLFDLPVDRQAIAPTPLSDRARS